MRRLPVSHRLTAAGLNAALGLWALEALGILVSLAFIAGEGEGARTAARLVSRCSGGLLVVQGVSAGLVLACVLVRRIQQAEPLEPFDLEWLSALLYLILFGSTLYILLVGASSFRENRGFVARIDEKVKVAPEPGDPERGTGAAAGGRVSPARILQSYRESSAELAVSASLGAASAIGLLVLHLMGWLESLRGP